MFSISPQSLDAAISKLLSEFALLISTEGELLELEHLRSKWRRIEAWKSSAEQLLIASENVAGRTSHTRSEIERLKYRILEAKAELSMTPESLMKAAGQAARGEGIPASELRAELQARLQSRSVAR